MTYLKSFLVGIGGAVAATVFWIVFWFIVPEVLSMLIDWLRNRSGIGAVAIDSGSILIVAVVGFVIATAWGWRRFRLVP
jgi:hypothetical protein